MELQAIAQEPLLLVDPSSSGRFSVVYHSPDSLAEKSRVVVFDAKSGTPLLVQALPHKAHAATYIPREDGEGEYNIIYLHDDCDLSLLTMNTLGTSTSVTEDSDHGLAKKNGILSAAEQDKTILNDLFGQRHQTAKDKNDIDQSRLETIDAKDARLPKADIGRRYDTDGLSILSAPSHVLPSVDQLFATFMDSLMSLRLKDPAEELTEEMDVDKDQLEEMEDASLAEPPKVTSVQLEDFTSLDAYFAESLKLNGKLVKNKQNNNEKTLYSPVLFEKDLPLHKH